MATVSELKEKARQLEQEGKPDKALQIYRHILKHFEGGPSVVKVLPLYVKVGDLLLKTRRTGEAVRSYERAAESYAENGAAQRVAALCSKIERVDPSRADCYAHFARRLIAHHHVGSARDVLASYAASRELHEMEEALDDLAGRPTEVIKPMLDRLLAAWPQGEAAPTGEAARRMSSQLQLVTDDETGDLDPDPEVPVHDEESPTVGRVAPVVFITQDSPPSSAPPPVRESPVGATAPRQAIALEERLAQIRANETQPQARPSNRPIAIAFAAGVVVGLGLALVLPFGGSNEAPVTAATPAPSPADSTPSQPAPPPATADTAADSLSPADSALAQPDSAGASPDSAAAPGTPPAPDDTPPPPPPPSARAEGPIVVDGLAVASISPSVLRGVAGYRVVQTLASHGELTIESYPDTTASTTVGRIRVLVTPPDTLVGIVRLPGHMVYASAVMPEDSLRSLMSRLVRQSN